MKQWPALDVRSKDDRVLAALNDFAPTGIEEREAGLRVFFPVAANRDAAQAMLQDQGITAHAVDVPEGDWAVQSQRDLPPIVVGRITVVTDPESPSLSPLRIVIRPSMGFGTAHHATTRLCLAALQSLSLDDASVLDVGTGSGILAIAAGRLGACRAIGIDNDAEAIRSASSNLALNPEASGVQFAAVDLLTDPLPASDVVTANLTGALLISAAPMLLGAVEIGGTLVIGGILAQEEEAVGLAFSRLLLVARQQEDEWVCLTLWHRATSRPRHRSNRGS